MPRRRGPLGRSGARKRRRPPSARRRRRARVQVLPRRLRRGRVPAPRRGRPRGGDEGACRLQCSAARPRGAARSARSRGGVAAQARRVERAHVPALPPLASARSRRRSDRAPREAARDDQGADSRRAPLVGERDGARAPREGSRPPAHRRDDAALPAPRVGSHPRRRDGVQVRAAHPRARKPREAVGWARRRRDRLGRDRSLAVHAGAEEARSGRLRRRVGRDRVAAARAFGRVDRGAQARARRRGVGAVDVGGAGAPRRAVAQGAHRTRLRRRSRRVGSRRELRRHEGADPPSPQDHPVRRADAVR